MALSIWSGVDDVSKECYHAVIQVLMEEWISLIEIYRQVSAEYRGLRWYDHRT